MEKNYFSARTKTLIFIVSFTIIIIVGFVLYQFQMKKLESEFNFNVKSIIKKDINHKFLSIESILTSLVKINQSNQEMTSSSFAIFTQDLLKQSAFINTVMYSSKVLEKDKNSFEIYMKDNGYYNFNISSYDKSKNTFITSPSQAVYTPVVLIEPSTYKFTKYIGYDIFNNKLLKDSFEDASKTGQVVSKNTKLFTPLEELLFIKAAYFGEEIPSLELERITNLKGFYIVNVDVQKIFKEYTELYKNYHIQIVLTPEIDSALMLNKSFDTIKTFSSVVKINDSSNMYLYITKDIYLNDINTSLILFILLMLMVVHLLVVFIVEKNKYVKKELSYQATHDDLTGLTNRNYFKNIVEDIIDSHDIEPNNMSAILFIDLDKFKDINDTLGHKFGDEVLIEISKRFKDVMRNNDTICRHGGDEFLIILKDISDVEDIIYIVRKIMDNVSKPIHFEQHTINLTISMGISLFPNDGKTVDDLLKNADSAMYKAKDEGRNTFKFYTEDMTTTIMKKVQLENDLREAIIDDDFVVFYQPQYNAQTNCLIGMEALVRWERKDKKIISPIEFIPMANETGLIVELDRLVMNKAIKQFSIWKHKNLNPGVLSLNLSMKHLKCEDFIEYLQNSIVENNCTYADIELEIIEDEIMEDPLGSIAKLKIIKESGIKISIDDFGTGHSSLAYLKNLPVNKLKIDRAFIKDLPSDNFDIAISRTVIELAKNLHLDLIAEGVETVEQKDFLLKNGCENMQGFFYNKPMPSDEMTILLHSISE